MANSSELLDLYIITLTTIFINSYFLFVGPLYVNLALDKGISEFEVGIIVGAFPLSGIVSTLLSPQIGQIFGRKCYTMVCLFICFITGIMMGYLKEIENKRTFFWASIIARVIHGHADYTYVSISASHILTLY